MFTLSYLKETKPPGMAVLHIVALLLVEWCCLVLLKKNVLVNSLFPSFQVFAYPLDGG
jgi:hypothetical protein